MSYTETIPQKIERVENRLGDVEDLVHDIRTRLFGDEPLLNRTPAPGSEPCDDSALPAEPTYTAAEPEAPKPLKQGDKRWVEVEVTCEPRDENDGNCVVSIHGRTAYCDPSALRETPGGGE